MPADIPARDLHRYAHYVKLMADTSATGNERAIARKNRDKLERAYPGIAAKAQTAQTADPEGFWTAVWRVFREAASEGFEEARKADARQAEAPRERPAGDKLERKPPSGPAPTGTAIPGIGAMQGHFRANDDKHLCVLTITIRGVDSQTPISDRAAFAASVAEVARGTVVEWLESEDAVPSGGGRR